MDALLDLYERTDRACLGTDPEAFFPHYASDAAEAPAKDICQRCSVREACLNFAIETQQKYGIWGGLTPDERAAEIRRRNKAARLAQLQDGS